MKNKFINNNDYSYPEGSCPTPSLYEAEQQPIVIYNHEGEPLTQAKAPLGFDLTSE